VTWQVSLAAGVVVVALSIALTMGPLRGRRLNAAADLVTRGGDKRL